GVYLITGGLGSVGLLIANHLARTLHSKLILTARQLPPPREEWQTYLDKHGSEDPICGRILAVLRLEELGAEVVLSNADAGDEKAVRELLDDVYRRFGSLNGVIHAAGITSGRSLYKSYTEINKA